MRAVTSPDSSALFIGFLTLTRAILRLFGFIALLTLTDSTPAAAAPVLNPADAQTYHAAFEMVRAGNWTEARRLAATARDPLLNEVIIWLDFQEPGRGGTFTELYSFLQQHPDWPQRGALRREAERQMPEGLPPRVVVDWFKDEPPLTGVGAMKLATALISMGRNAEAAELIRHAWIELAFSPPEERTYASMFNSYLHPAEHVQRLDRLLWASDEAAVRRMFTRVDGGSRTLAEARLALRSMSKRADSAVRKVPVVLRNDPGLIYERARWRRRKEQYPEAAQILDRPAFNTPFSDRIWVERDDAARHALDRGDAHLAYRLAKNHGIKSGPAFADGEFLAGWIALRYLHQPKTALHHFELLYAGVSSPISAARGAYWAGRAAEAMNDKANAEQWYNIAVRQTSTYYGQLSARRLGLNEATDLPTLPPVAPETKAKFETREMVRMVRALEQVGAREWTRPFFLTLIGSRASPEDYLLAAELAIELQRPDLALTAAKSGRGTVNLVEHLFPVRPLPASLGVEEALLLSVMRQESAFDPTAVSSAGALGLMQLMPATAKTVAQRNGMAYKPGLLTDDPDYNVRLGSAYLSSLLSDYGGSYVLALSAYNAGPSRVSEWLAAHGDPRDSKVDAVDWVEAIPLSETRNYVQRIMETLAIYRHRLGAGKLALTLDQDLKR
jgi:soluble lytic murein transglycosylase